MLANEERLSSFSLDGGSGSIAGRHERPLMGTSGVPR